ncbi:MAG: hypothetical protein ACE5KM_18815 [Planctomycetaceae bacterium]
MTRKFLGWMFVGVFAVALSGTGSSVFGGHCGDYDDDDDGCCKKSKCCKKVKCHKPQRCCKPVKCRAPKPRCCKPAPTCCKPAPTCCAPRPSCSGGTGGAAPKKAPSVPKDDKPPAPKKTA